jgi:YegS/Rv2252/BmrU family lipid kinase
VIATRPSLHSGEPRTSPQPLKALAIVNPRSGGQAGPQVARWLTETAQARKIRLTVRETSLEQDARELVRDAVDFDRVIAAGGDGTIMQVINGIARRHEPLAIIPAGTGNALAMALGLTMDLRRACQESLAAADLFPLDLGLLNDELYFALRLGIGYEAIVTKDVTRELKTRLGKSAYVLQAVRHAIQMRSVSYRFDVDGKFLRRRAESVWVANAGSLGILGLDLDPNIQYGDGQLDLCVMRFGVQRDVQIIVRRLFNRQRLPASVLSRVPVRNVVRIAAHPRQPIQADGEVVGETPCEVRVVPAAVMVCRPAGLLPSEGQGG